MVLMNVLEILPIAAVILAGVFTLVGVGKWLYERGAHVVAEKAAEVLEKGASVIDGMAIAAKGAGLKKVGVALEEFSDVPDEVGDVATKIAGMIKNQDFTKDSFLELWDEGTDVVVEAKDFIIKVIKKK